MIILLFFFKDLFQDNNLPNKGDPLPDESNQIRWNLDHFQELIEHIELFNSQNAEEISSSGLCFNYVEYNKNDIIIQQGKYLSSCYFIYEGKK